MNPEPDYRTLYLEQKQKYSDLLRDYNRVVAILNIAIDMMEALDHWRKDKVKHITSLYKTHEHETLFKRQAIEYITEEELKNQKPKAA
jgi:hypothetical protein